MADSSLVEQLCRQAARLDEQALADLETTPLPPSAVHDCRVRAKRLRALWQLLRPWLCRDDHKLHDRTVRDGARALAGARDHYVMAATLQTLAGKADKPQRKALSRVSQTLFADNHPQPEPSHHQDAIAAFLADRERWQTLNLTLSDHDLLVTGLARTYKQCRNRTIKAQGGRDADAWHDLRKWVKYLLYQQETLTELGVTLPASSTDLAQLGKRLGKLHDLHMLRTFIGEHSQHIERHKDLKATREAIDHREQALLNKCQNAARALFQTPTRKWIEKVSMH